MPKTDKSVFIQGKRDNMKEKLENTINNRRPNRDT